MSELSSLYLKVKIEKSQLEKFLNSKFEKPALNQNWLEWWESRRMYSKMELSSELFRIPGQSNQEFINSWLEYPQAMAFSDYNEVLEEWHFGMLFFSENYEEMLSIFAFITSLEKYLNKDSENFAVVFPFFWGDNDVQAYIYFENEKAILSPQVQTTEDLNSEILMKTQQYLNTKWEELSKNMDVD